MQTKKRRDTHTARRTRRLVEKRGSQPTRVGVPGCPYPGAGSGWKERSKGDPEGGGVSAWGSQAFPDRRRHGFTIWGGDVEMEVSM